MRSKPAVTGLASGRLSTGDVLADAALQIAYTAEDAAEYGLLAEFDAVEAALERKARAQPPKVAFDGEFDARLTALACSPAPDGRARWTVRLLAEKAVELKIAACVSSMTVQRS